MHDLNDAELLAAWSNQDQVAYAVLVARHHGLVRSTCSRQVSQKDVDDCVQAVFLVLSRRPAAAARAPTLPAWLLRVAWYVCGVSRRSGERRRTAERAAAIANAPPAQHVESEALDHLDDCLQLLPEKQREAVSLHYLSGKSPEEIASALGTSRENAYKLVARGLTGLRNLLARRGVSIGSPALVLVLASEAQAVTVAAPPMTIASVVTGSSSIGVKALASGAMSAMTVAVVTPVAMVAGVLLSFGVASTVVIQAHVKAQPTTVTTMVMPSAPAGEYPLLPNVVYTCENAPPTPTLEELPLVESVSQYGITWTFETPVRVGRFINGDWYVVGKPVVRHIDPRPIYGSDVQVAMDASAGPDAEIWFKDKAARNGSTLNPPANGRACGFDSRIMARRYNHNLFTHLPIAMRPGDALISTISRSNDDFIKNGGHPLRVAAVLTCVADPLPADAFRPAYVGRHNSNGFYLARNLRRDVLQSLDRPTMSAPANLDRYARRLQKPWIDLVRLEMSFPKENMPTSSDQLTQRIGEASLLLQCNYDALDKEHVVVGLVQAGIDFFGLAQGGFSWFGHGNHHSGRKWTILLAGGLLGNMDMLNLQDSVPLCHFAEDDQTTFGPVAYRGQSFSTSWSGAKAIHVGHSPFQIHPTREGEAEHWAQWRGMLDVYAPFEWPPLKKDVAGTIAQPGIATTDSRGDMADVFIPLQSCSVWVGQALAARMLRMEKTWGHDAFFACVDRWMTEDDSALVSALRAAQYADFTKRPHGSLGRAGFVSGPPWVNEMWQRYRNHLPGGIEEQPTPDAEDTWR